MLHESSIVLSLFILSLALNAHLWLKLRESSKITDISSKNNDVKCAGVQIVDCFRQCRRPLAMKRDGFWFGSKHKRWRLLRKIVGEMGYKKVEHPNDTSLFWMFIPPYATNHTAFKPFREHMMVVNHSPNDRKQFLKEALLLHLREYTNKFKCNMNNMHPKTFRIHMYDECIAFLQYEARMSTKKMRMYRWYTKVLNSFGGDGINRTSSHDFIMNNTNTFDIRKFHYQQHQYARICNDITTSVNKTYGGLLIQRALPRPFLIHRRKFDMRVYMLIANHKPYYVFYHRGFIRRAQRRHNIHSTDQQTYLTNTALQSKHKKYRLEDHRWWFEDELLTYMKSLGYTKRQFWNIFGTQIQRLLMHVFLATKPHLERRNGYYLLVGVDVLVNEDLNLRVLEVNTAPRMTNEQKEVGSKYVRVQKAMLKEMLKIVQEVHYKVQSNDDYDPLYIKTARKWQLIYTDNLNNGQEFRVTKAKCFKQPVYKPIVKINDDDDDDDDD